MFAFVIQTSRQFRSKLTLESFFVALTFAANNAALAVPSSTTLITSPVGSVTFGQQVTLTATVLPAVATGKVTFYDGAYILGTRSLSAGQASLKTTLLPAGSRMLTALYSGDANYAASVSSAVRVAVNTIAAGAFAVQQHGTL